MPSLADYDCDWRQAGLHPSGLCHLLKLLWAAALSRLLSDMLGRHLSRTYDIMAGQQAAKSN